MASTFVFLLAIISVAFGGWPTRDIVDVDEVTKIAFYDFDRTLLIESFGGVIVKLCRGFYNDTYITNPCDSVDELLDVYEDIDNRTWRTVQAFGGQCRIDRLKEHLDVLLDDESPIADQGVYVVSTSWGEVPALEWQKFINSVFILVGLDTYFPFANIFTLDDPGEGIQADKGAPILAKIEALAATGVDISPEQCIFADDKQGNLNWALSDEDVVDPAGRNYCDTLLVQERAGMDRTDLNYYEARTILPADNCTTSITINNPKIQTQISERNLIIIIIIICITVICCGLIIFCCYREKNKKEIEIMDKQLEMEKIKAQQMNNLNLRPHNVDLMDNNQSLPAQPTVAQNDKGEHENDTAYV